ncbi:MAG: ArnT family glycosyltransferase [bacterium]
MSKQLFSKLLPDGNYEKLAWIVSCFMLLFLLFVSQFHRMGGYGVETDFYWAYAPDAQNILEGKMPEEPGVGPGYALVLALFNIIFNDWFTAGKMVSIFSTILGGYFTFKMIQKVFDEKIAFYTMILWQVTVLPFAIVASTDMFFAFLVAVAIYFFFRSEELDLKNLILSAGFMGYAYLTRHNAIVLPIAVGIILLLINPYAVNWMQRIKPLLVFTGAFILLYLPWSILLFATGGNAVRSDSYLIIASHFYGRPGIIGSEDMRLAAQKFDSLKSVIFYDVAYFVKHYLFNLYHHFYDVLTQSLKFPTLLFVGAGGFVLLPKLNKRLWSFLLFPLLSFLMLCLVHYEPRYYLYFIAFFVLFAVYFIFRENNQLQNVRKMNLLRGVVFGVTVLFVFVFSLKEIKKTIADEPRELLEMSQFLRQHTVENQTIIARKPHIGFLSNLETVYFPQVNSISELLQFAAQEKADYLFYGEEEAKRRPELLTLLDPQNAPDELEPLLVWEHPKSVIYKLRI